jgi:hypothetical protein
MKPKEMMLFPGFWEVDYNWWWAKEIAMNGMYKNEVAELQTRRLTNQRLLNRASLMLSKDQACRLLL